MNYRRSTSILISIITLVAIAFVSAYFPQYYFYLIIVYLVVMFAVTMIFTGKQTGKTIKDLEYILGGEKLLEVSSARIIKLRERDKIFLKKEAGSEWIMALAFFLPLVILFVILIIPGLKETLMAYIIGIVQKYVHDETFSKFVGFLVFFSSFIIVSYIPYKITHRYYQSRGRPYYLIPTHYVLTDRGLIINRTTPLKFPLKAKAIKSQGSRKLVDIIGVKGIPSFVRGQEIVVRLYCDEPKKLAELLRKYSKIESSAKKRS
ncbi:MAG: hypothetical protein DRJ52_00745 [Thermoprotei archaeon]|nr:MAG: hypothetical protein DRJ52_00745 [Thermoprotei archaeon]RLF00421.1 MAG: hypothetical protein DRJ63_02460 [Thermoprotei archaeon]